MSFSIGETVGPYKITRYIGQGGTATIFRAHQTNVDREVALKVIHPALKEDQTFVARLKREAHIIAKLNHPNIVTLYDFLEFDGLPCLVLQYIEGKTLRDLIRERTLSPQLIRKIIRSVGEALEYAHTHGILHRDVKPSNILIDQDERIYLTDFGLARIATNSESTMSQDMIIGSPQYVSPEQAKSEPVDARTDVYSFGIVIYEMLTGRVPFQSDTPYSTILAQINTPPPQPRVLNPAIPPAVEQVLLKALAKDRHARYASIREMLNALDAAFESRETTTARASVWASIQRRLAQWRGVLNARLSPRRIAAFAGILALALPILCIVGMTLFILGFSGSNAKTNSAGKAAGLTSSPAAPSPTKITTTPRPENPSTIVPAPASSPRGKIAYSIATGDLAEQHSIWIANADGTNARVILEAANWPSLSPDGKQIAYHRIKDEGIYVANNDGSNARRIVSGETCCVQWSPDGKRLLYVQGNLKRGDTKIMMVNVDGSGSTEITSGYNPAWSPEGNRIVYAGCQPNTTQCGLFVYDLKSKNAVMITRDAGGVPQWSPRAERIVYQASDGKGHIAVFVINADGSGGKQLTFGKGNDGQPTWSSEGNFIFWRSDQNGTGWAIYVMNADGTNSRLLIKSAPPDGNLWARESLSTSP
jgi:serine/threonine protein kinase